MEPGGEVEGVEAVQVGLYCFPVGVEEQQEAPYSPRGIPAS